MPTFGHIKVRTEYLEATLGLVKRLEISKELIRECVTVAGCCCCMPLLRNHLMNSCSYDLCSLKYITSRQRGVHLHPPYPPWIRHRIWSDWGWSLEKVQILAEGLIIWERKQFGANLLWILCTLWLHPFICPHDLEICDSRLSYLM